MKKITVDISGMHCRSCEMLVEEELLKVPSVEKAKTSFRKGCAEIFSVEEKPDIAAIAEAIRKAGYTVGRSERTWFSRDIGAWVEALSALGIVFVLFVVARSLGLFDISLGSSQKLSSLPFVVLLGLAAGFSTCMAMVGGLVLAASARYSEAYPEASVRQKFLPHLSFNLGRIVGFSIFGAMLGFLGSAFSPSSFSVGMLTVLVALVMLLLGLQLLELFPRLSAWKLMLPKDIAKMLGIQSWAKQEYSHTRSMMLGAATFFLPCGFTQLVQLFVATRGSALVGALTMGMFALGTAPGLLGIGGITASAQGNFRRFFFRITGVIVVVLGVFNFQNGIALVRIGSENAAVDGENSAIAQKAINEDVQIVRITQTASGYVPDRLVVKKGRPVRLVVDSQDPYTCAVSFMIPKIGVRQMLKPGENIFSFTPDQIGQIPFSCSMGMYRGIIDVID